ncbi:HD domain-containing protein [Jiella sp. MQZ9-1]|uniref:HD domain-containing protein n=1 Tax=Jiella flava TaxID=2816857 RepID=A0A939FYU8_9HYPH|nr:HD domain-containing phosphohydrolase [Jiella flava]MBO0662012.1 HD domain-containing protein [Jiella flava]MCD2470661.1 HD domain-containing protein [Jiella flava]
MTAHPNVPPKTTLRLAEILAALSKALDMTEGQPAGHCVRCCYIGVRIGQQIGLAPTVLGDLYYTLLLKDLGCSSNAARICELYLTDDLSFKRNFKEIDDSLAHILRFILQQTGLKAGLAERFRALVHIVCNGGKIAQELIETRCQRGAVIARKMRFSETVAAGIHSLDEHFDGGGRPNGLTGEAIPLFSRIALLAQVSDVFLRIGGLEAALGELKARAGIWFDPALVAAFEALTGDPDFAAALREDDLSDLVLTLEPGEDRRDVDEDYLDDIAEAFAEVVDSKSPYTSGHSERVALFTDMIAEAMDYTPAQRRRLRRAALLHDIGKLGVSNAILDKPGKLDDDEFAVIRQHPVHSEAILSQITAFAELAAIGGRHHERLDGRGYPYGLSAADISMDTRIVTVADIFDALTADRPYRPAMPLSRALAILDADIGTAVDGDCVAALKQALARLESVSVAA